MTESLLVGLASILIFGIGAQWLAWRLRLPSILLLLIVGLVAGPATGFLDPDQLFGDLLLPLVSLSVAVILFEGGLSLRVAELRETGGVVRNLISIGVVVTWLTSAGAARLLLNLNWPLALLLGAIVVVTGPTVIGPLLRHVRPTGQVSSIVKWEGILNDPIGAILAVLIFEAILPRGVEQGPQYALLGVLRAGLVGGFLGVLGGRTMVLLLKRYWIPDFLQNPLSLMAVVTVFTISNVLQTEAGLLAVTVMGVVLANQKAIAVKHIIEFKENLSVLLLSSLFIILAARLHVSDLAYLNMGSLAFLAILIVIVRPAAVAISALGSDLSWRERLFISWLAPRGVVSAAVASIFALELAGSGHPGTGQLVPITFLVIIGTVTIYGVTATPIARRLRIADPNPQGALIIGAHPWAQAVARALRDEGYPVLLVDTDRISISTARMVGLPTFHASILSDAVLDRIELGGIGRLLALTPNDEVNTLAAVHFSEVFDRSEIYQLPPEGEGEDGKAEKIPRHLRGRLLFGRETTYRYLTARFEAGAVIKKTLLTDQFNYEAFQSHYRDEAIPLFVITEHGALTVFAADNPPQPQPGQRLISLVEAMEEPQAHSPQALSPGETRE